jgi:hypothetical protein
MYVKVHRSFVSSKSENNSNVKQLINEWKSMMWYCEYVNIVQLLIQFCTDTNEYWQILHDGWHLKTSK